MKFYQEYKSLGHHLPVSHWALSYHRGHTAAGPLSWSTAWQLQSWLQPGVKRSLSVPEACNLLPDPVSPGCEPR